MLVFTADSVYRDEMQYGRSDIWTVTTDGALKKLTSNVDYSYANATFSPDGNWILATRSTPTDAVIRKKMDNGGPVDIVCSPANGGKEINLTESWDYLPTGAFWYPDGKHIYFTGGIGGTTHLFRVAPTGGAVEQVTKGERRLSSVRIRLVDEARWRISSARSRRRRRSGSRTSTAAASGSSRTSTTRSRRKSRSARASGVQFKSADGTPIEGWLLYPYGYRAGATSSYPLIVAQPWRSAQRRRLRLRFQESVFRGEWLLRAAGELPQLDGLRREVPLGRRGARGARRTART